MNSLKMLALVVAASVLLSSCAPTVYDQPEHRKVPTVGLKLAVVVTEQTRAAVKAAQKMTGTSSGVEGFNQANKPFEAVVNVLQKDFDEVRMVDTVEQARAGGADLIGVLNMKTLYHQGTFTSFHVWDILPLIGIVIDALGPPNVVDIDASVAFKTLDQAEIDTASAHTHVEQVSGTINTLTPNEAGHAAWLLEDALVKSRPLAQFAAARRQKASAAPVAVAVAAAPAVPPPAAEKAPGSDVDAPTYQRAEDPNKFALVIGIEKYKSLPDASFAEHDAAAVREHLVALGFPARNILYLAGERAGRAAFEKYIESWLPRNVNEESHVFVYFSGHGAPDAETRQVYLVPWDGDPKFLKDTAYPVSRLFGKLNELKAKEIVVAMDSCFSGAGGRSVLAQGTRPLVTKVDLAAGSAGRLVVLSASAGDQVSGTDERQAHGLFTYNLLKTLNEKRGQVDVRTAYLELRPRVEDESRRQNRSQSPQLLAPAPYQPVEF